MGIKNNILALCISIPVVLSNTSNVQALQSINSIEGVDRYETAAMIAQRQKYEKAILVNADNSLADGLSASGLAGAIESPILLVKNDSIPNATLNSLTNVDEVYIVGGESSISLEVEKKLKEMGIKVTRIGGNDRIETSYNVAMVISEMQPVENVILTNAYKGEADAMSIAPVAVKYKSPIILTDGNNVPFDIESTDSYAIGGNSLIDESLIKSTNSIRIGGIDRFDTNKKIINRFYPDVKEFYLAKGWQLVDALTASVISKDRPIVLVNENSDKSILKGATKVTSIGGVNNVVIQQCLDSINEKITVRWKEIDKKWYYFNEDGSIRTGWLNDKGMWYYLKSNGEMATNTTVEEWDINSNGEATLFKYSAIPNHIKNKMNGKSMPHRAKVKYSDLSYVRVTYYGFDNNSHVGEIVVDKRVAKDIVDIFTELYEKKYPIEKIKLIDEYNADDNLSMKNNNSSAFCYRTIAGTNTLSNHSKGTAIDINTVQNPYVKPGSISPSEGKGYVNRSNVRKGMIIKNDVCYNAFIKRGWKWGGSWTNPDYQHFEKTL